MDVSALSLPETPRHRWCWSLHYWPHLVLPSYQWKYLHRKWPFMLLSRPCPLHSSSVLPVERLNKPLIFPANLTLCMSECDISGAVKRSSAFRFRVPVFSFPFVLNAMVFLCNDLIRLLRFFSSKINLWWPLQLPNSPSCFHIIVTGNCGITD